MTATLPEARAEPTVSDRKDLPWARPRWIASMSLIAITKILLVVTGFLSAVIPLVAEVWADVASSSSSPRFYGYLLLGYVAFFTFPVLLTLPVLLPLAVTWREPRRIIVFRRFNRGREGAVLRRLLTRNLARFGHVFTLADSAIRVPWTVRIPVLLGQLALVHFRPRMVKSDRQLLKLQRRLDQRRWLNVNWFVSSHKMFPVRSSDRYWQRCVTALLAKADLVVVDISVPRETLLWEIVECARRGLVERMIFTASRDSEAESQAWKSEITKTLPELETIPIWWYHHRGLDDASSFRSSVAQRLAQPVAPAPRVSLGSQLVGLAGTVSYSSALALLACIACAPYLFGQFTARHSPWRWPIYQAYFYGTTSDVALARLQQDFSDTMISELLLRARSDDAFLRKKALGGLVWMGDQAIAPLAELARSGVPDVRNKVVDGIAQIGGRRAIAPLVELANSGAQETRDRAENELRTLVKRLGSSAFLDYMNLLQTAATMDFDREIYGTFEDAYRATASATALALLDAPSEAARYTAAYRLASENELRAVPTLLEMLVKPKLTRLFDLRTLRSGTGTYHPYESECMGHLDRLLQQGKGELEFRKLLAHLSGPTEVATYAAMFAFAHGSVGELQDSMRAMPPPTALLSELARWLAVPANEQAARAAEVIAVADDSWLVGLLRDPDENLRLDAALALAVRGDARGLMPTLDLLRQKEPCGVLDFQVGPCFRFEARGLPVLRYLATTLPQSGHFPGSLEHVTESSIYALIELAHVVTRTRDGGALKSLIRYYARHPDADRGDSRFPFRTISSRMAENLPDHVTDWVVKEAIHSAGSAGAALQVLARALIRGRCGYFLYTRDLSEMWKRCQRQAGGS